MKKALAIILALLMVLSLASLAACAEKKEETKAPETEKTETKEPEAEGGITEDVLKASKNNEYVQEKLDAGWDMRIDWSLQQDNFFTHTQLAEAAEDIFEEAGFVRGTIFCAADDNITDQISQIETIVTANEVCGLCVQTGDPAAIQDVIESAQEAGITVVIYGIRVDYDTIVAMTDTYQAGMGAAVMAGDWVSVKYPDAGEGEIHVSVLGSQIIPPVIELTQGMLDGVEADSRFTMGYYGDNLGDTMENGYTGAENALMVDPDIRVFILYQMTAGLGVNNYLEAQGLDMTQYGIFATSEDDTTAEMLEKAANGQGSFRGTIVAGGGVADTTAYTMIEALVEGTVPLGTTRIDPMVAWTSSDYTCDFTIG